MSRQRPRVEIVTLVRVDFLLGEGGAPSDPVRQVSAYYDMAGSLVFEVDPFVAEPVPEPAVAVPSPVIEPVSPVEREPVAAVAKPPRKGRPPKADPAAVAAYAANHTHRDTAEHFGIPKGSVGGYIARAGKVRVLPDGAPAPLPAKAEPPAGETFEERRQRVARERHAQTWRELHPDAVQA